MVSISCVVHQVFYAVFLHLIWSHLTVILLSAMFYILTQEICLSLSVNIRRDFHLCAARMSNYRRKLLFFYQKSLCVEIIAQKRKGCPECVIEQNYIPLPNLSSTISHVLQEFLFVMWLLIFAYFCVVLYFSIAWIFLFKTANYMRCVEELLKKFQSS